MKKVFRIKVKWNKNKTGIRKQDAKRINTLMRHNKNYVIIFDIEK